MTEPRGEKNCEDWKKNCTRTLFVTNSVQLVQGMPYQGSSGRVWKLQRGGQIIHTLKYADELVLLAKEETVLQDMIDKLTEVGICCGMEMNVEKK
jgi:hypothetical protein